MRTFISLIITAFLCASCGDSGNTNPNYDGGTSNDGNNGGAAPSSGGNVPAGLAKNLRSFTFSDDKQSVKINMATLDTTPLEATFIRNPSLDQAGYLAYSIQEDPLDRLFIALGGESADGDVRAGVVSDGGQFNKILQGGFYQRDGKFDRPEIGIGPGEGQVSYAGNYAGITNLVTPQGADLLPIPGDVNPSDLPDLPSQPFTVTGTVFLNANFADNSVNGEIYNRVLISPINGSVVENLASLSLIIADIDGNGEFFGSVEPTGEEGSVVGSYGGIFGGEDASYAAGLASIDDAPSELYDLEVGFFVLTQCGLPGDAAVCDVVEPN